MVNSSFPFLPGMSYQKTKTKKIKSTTNKKKNKKDKEWNDPG
jgi:hypothetical protein